MEMKKSVEVEPNLCGVIWVELHASDFLIF